jgi:hypothetical protein
MVSISSHPQILQRAYEIFQERRQTGRKGDALSGWLEAERQILRRRIPVPASTLDLHPTPTTLPLTWRGFKPRTQIRPHPESARRSAVAWLPPLLRNTWVTK